MAKYVLNAKVRVVPCRTICKLRKNEILSENEKQKRTFLRI